MERKLQSEIVQFLKAKGAYVLKNDATYRQGVPDLAFWHPDLNGFIEVKAHEKSAFQPLQKLTIKKMKDMGIFCEIIDNENWPEWKARLGQWLNDYSKF